MDLQKFTIKTQEAIQQAQNFAEAKGHQLIEPGHLLQGIFAVDQEVIPYLLKKMGVNITVLSAALDRIVDGYPKVSGGQVYISHASNRVFQSALTELTTFGDEFVSIELLFYALLDSADTIGKLLKDNKISKSTLKNAIMDVRKRSKS